MNIAIIGYGKMGKEIEKIALSRNHQISIIIDKNNQQDLDAKNLKGTNIAIEFTQPDTAYENYLKCFAADIPVVSGTTGWFDKLNDIKKYCHDKRKAFFYASNFSIGVNLFFSLNRQLARMMNDFSDYNISLTEIHHIYKKDAPSGTAITLAEDIIANHRSKKKWVNHVINDKKTLPIISKRESEITGIHTINYTSDVDTISITHNAKSRKGFAIGAVMAAEFLQGKTGFYEMKNLLDFMK